MKSFLTEVIFRHRDKGDPDEAAKKIYYKAYPREQGFRWEQSTYAERNMAYRLALSSRKSTNKE